MWTRAELKERAKADLKPFYWYGVLVCFIAGILGAGTSGGSGSIRRQSGSSSGNGSHSDITIGYGNGFATFMMVLGMIVVILLLAAALGIFVSNLIKVGKLRFFMESASTQSSAGIDRLFFAFRNGHYANVMVTMFCKGLFEYLWMLLLVIPGIYKHYEYYMIPYLLAENPDMDRHEAFRLSKEMMDGNKLDTFVMELSFIGWYILGTLMCCVGVFLVHPYYEMTFVELYWVLRDRVLGPQQSVNGNGYTDTTYYEV